MSDKELQEDDLIALQRVIAALQPLFMKNGQDVPRILRCAAVYFGCEDNIGLEEPKSIS